MPYKGLSDAERSVVERFVEQTGGIPDEVLAGLANEKQVDFEAKSRWFDATKLELLASDVAVLARYYWQRRERLQDNRELAFELERAGKESAAESTLLDDED